ncbi:MAG: hypothetical protein DRQ88_11595 [Epsilonproteobacteria bacterium]|nr:MAG: hypothetical protein DRQ89_08020 [Campylobacterota bacterium]RLA64029.1 MAG: hypothetical protein DRQ88_11595 [Campylobacterota bacterium]
MSISYKGQIYIWPLLFLILISASCTKDKRLVGKSLQEIELINRGRTVYMTTCVVCHNLDPKRVGPTGPAIHNSSLELVKEKLLKGGYPAGYKPQRKTHLMPTFIDEHEKDIDAIHAFLNL